ncbi:putative ribosomal protein L34 [Fusobacterium sp. CM21]|nr:putative ribosomal protein L34 [Fusobacterium sp. CM21]
MFLQTK